MADNALEPLLSSLGDASPAGDNLEYDADFLALERAAAPKTERVIGDSVKAAEEPDWEKVADLAQALLGRSRDLRVAVHLATAWTCTSGLTGWLDGLGLIRGLLENLWESVHPQLDAEDDNDPTARVNAVAPLSDMHGALGYFRTAAFAQSPRLGRFSLRDLDMAEGTLKAVATEGGTLPSLTEIEACCMDCPEEQLIGAMHAVDQAFGHAQAIDAIFTAQLGANGPDLKALLGETQRLGKFLQAQVSKRAPQAVEGGETDAASEDAGDGGGAAASNGRINGPQDVLRRLDELCDYYARCEPSSPVPLLLRRAKRLVGKDFIDLLKDLAPAGVSELQVVSGKPDEE